MSKDFEKYIFKSAQNESIVDSSRVRKRRMPVRDRMTGSVTGIVGSPDDNGDANRVMTVQEVGERLRKRHPKHLQLLTNYKLEKLLTLIQGT